MDNWMNDQKIRHPEIHLCLPSGLRPLPRKDYCPYISTINLLSSHGCVSVSTCESLQAWGRWCPVVLVDSTWQVPRLAGTTGRPRPVKRRPLTTTTQPQPSATPYDHTTAQRWPWQKNNEDRQSRSVEAVVERLIGHCSWWNFALELNQRRRSQRYNLTNARVLCCVNSAL